MATEPICAPTTTQAPIERAAFASLRLTRDPDSTYATACRILASTRDPEAALASLSPYVDGHGVESLALADGTTLHYVNAGDTYRATVCHVFGRGYFVSSWGDEYERADRAHEADTGERRCAYCSAWADPAEPCGSCGRDPSTGDTWCEPLRAVRLETGHTLRTWDSGRVRNGRTCLRYELRDPTGAVLFAGDDFRPSPMHADDADATLRGLLGFLTLRPGDTDREYFDAYTPAQLAFAASSECELLAFAYSDDGEGTFADIDADDSDAGRADR